jgi:hypothetical protein
MSGNRLKMYEQNCQRSYDHFQKLAQVTRINARLARSYSDDSDIRSGAYSAPREHTRPGQRDDAENCMSSLLLAI